jgi:hypothetical protein
MRSMYTFEEIFSDAYDSPATANEMPETRCRKAGFELKSRDYVFLLYYLSRFAVSETQHCYYTSLPQFICSAHKKHLYVLLNIKAELQLSSSK